MNKKGSKLRFDNLFCAKACAIFFALYIFVVLDILNLENYSNQMSQDLSTQLFSYFYPKQPDDIIVINTDQNSVEHWPPTYMEYAQWIEFIADYTPKAIVIDIHFEQRRYAQFKGELINVLSEATDSGIKIYGIVDENSDPEITAQLTSIGTRWNGLENGYYPIRDINGHLMAGTQVYNDFYQPIAEDWTFPMFLKWPSRPTPSNSGYWSKLISGINCVFQCNAHADPKPYFDKFKVQQMYVSDIEAHKMFNDRIVFFGSERPATKDFFQNPIYGQVPGVFLHAMALDNLIKYHDKYFKRDDSKPIIFNQGSGGLIEIILLLFNLFLFMKYETWIGDQKLGHYKTVCIAFLKTTFFAIGCFLITLTAAVFSHLVLRNDPSNFMGLFATNLFAYELTYLGFAALFALLFLYLHKLKSLIINDKNYWRKSK